jgi:F-type H+-transporting ATPase subunit gamma
MTERLADVVSQIQNVRQLEAVVTAMRGIAASRAQKGRSLLPGIEAYSDVVSRAIGQALHLLPPDSSAPTRQADGRPGLILFCAEQGFAGAFSDRIIDAAANDLETSTILIIGSRGATVAGEKGVKAAWSTAMAAHVEAIPSFANRLVEKIYGYLANGALTRIDILFPRSTSGGLIRIDRHALLPIDYGRFKHPHSDLPPLTTLPPQVLIERLAAEYVFARICEAAMHAFEAENEARMLAMASARTNIGSKLTDLSGRERQLRQEEITTEIIELAAGSEALAGR